MPGRCHPDFEPLLTRHFAREALDRTPSTVFGLWPDGALAYVNDAWDTFADENGGQPEMARRWDLGARYFDAIAEPLLPFYHELLARASLPGAALRPASHEYDCSTGSVFRRFNMQVYALSGRAGYIVVNSLVVERPHDPGVVPKRAGERAAYADRAGVIHQCAHCRRVHAQDQPERWDWVAPWVDAPPAGTSHTICPTCFEYYYPLPPRDKRPKTAPDPAAG